MESLNTELFQTEEYSIQGNSLIIVYYMCNVYMFIGISCIVHTIMFKWITNIYVLVSNLRKIVKIDQNLHY